MKRLWYTIVLYAALPEMRLFWFFLPFLIGLSVLNALYLPQFWIAVSFTVFVMLAAVVLFNNLRLARSNLEVKIERNELKSIISNLQDGVIAYDPNFKILVFNRAAEMIFGVSAKEIIGTTIAPELAREPRYTLFIQVMFPSLAPVMVRRSDTGAYPQVVDFSFDAPQRMRLRVTTDRILDSAGRLLGFVRIAHDRTREVNLIQSKTEFISIAAHQLRTPLTTVHWSLESLATDAATDREKELTSAALTASARLLKIVNDILDVSKIEEGRFGFTFAAIDIVALVTDTMRDMTPTAERLKVKLYLREPAEPSLIVYGDADKLKMVLYNLFDNALKYNVENGEVVADIVRVPEQPFVQISIKDTGLGVPSEEMPRLFTRFFRATNAVKAATEGSGLGLYIVKNIVRRHGGDIWAESELNRGTTFYFTVPTDSNVIPQREMTYDEE